MKNLLLLVLFSSMVVGGCASQPRVYQRPPVDTNWGQPPVNYEAQVRAYFHGVLKDPTSPIYTFGEPARGYTNYGFKGDKSRAGTVLWTGWVVVVLVNAKNSYGAYTGNQRYFAMFNTDQSIKEIRPEVRDLGNIRIPHGVRFY